jgi:hypothetical protein
MIWPWISRAAAGNVLREQQRIAQELRSEVEYWRKELQAERERHREDDVRHDAFRHQVLELALQMAREGNGPLELAIVKLTELKREGFGPPPAAAELPETLELPQVILDAIEERASPGSELWRTLAFWAQKTLRTPVAVDQDGEEMETPDPNAVAQQILTGADIADLPVG